MTTIQVIYNRFENIVSKMDRLITRAEISGQPEAKNAMLSALYHMRKAQEVIASRLSVVPDVPLLRGPNARRVRPEAKGAYLLDSGAWKAKAQYEGKSIHLGYFDTEEEARAAYKSFWEDKRK